MSERWIQIDDEGFIGLVGPIEHLPFGRDGVGRFRFRAQDKHRNRNDFVQGGMLMTFADRSMGFTARQHDVKRRQATVQLDVHFIRAVRIDSVVNLEARIVRETRSMVFIDGELTVDGHTVATARGVWKIIAR